MKPHPLQACGHGVPLGCYCAPCRQIDDEADVPACGNAPDPKGEQQRFSRWPLWLRAWRRASDWPEDASECIE